MLYPNRLQAALLFDRPVPDLEAIMRDFTRIEGMRSGAQFNVPEANPGLFYRLFGGAEELMITFEYLDRPAAAEAFNSALSSPFNGIATPDIRDRIIRSQTHILLEVSHGVMGGVEDDPKIAEFLSQLGRPKEGATQGAVQAAARGARPDVADRQRTRHAASGALGSVRHPDGRRAV